jgi:hypothetical protein
MAKGGMDHAEARACAEYARRLKQRCGDPTWEEIAQMWDDSVGEAAWPDGARAGQGEG